MNDQRHDPRAGRRAWHASLVGLLLIVAVLWPASLGMATDSGLPGVTPGPTSLPGEGPGPRATQTPKDLDRPLPPRPGYIPPLADLSHLTAQTLPPSFAPQALPARFDWRDQGMVSPVRDMATTMSPTERATPACTPHSSTTGSLTIRLANFGTTTRMAVRWGTGAAI